MDEFQWLMLFHVVGYGFLAGLLAVGWLVHSQYTKASDYKAKAAILGPSRVFGLLSPFAILLVLVTGVGNMLVRGLMPTSEMWLPVKIILFVAASANGILFGIRSKRRGMLVGQLAQGKAAASAEERLVRLDATASVFLFLQTVLLAAILVITIWKP
jgi:hypothetical protein